MPGMLTPNSEILIILLISIVLTVMEAMYTNLHDNLRVAWDIKFQQGVYSSPVENIIRTVVFIVVLARGVTVHIYLAAHLIIIIPLLMERLRFVVIIWLVISGLRSIFVNFIVSFVGIIICASHPDVHSACFMFAGFKGFELACSLYMWVLVNNFLHYLRNDGLIVGSQLVGEINTSLAESDSIEEIDDDSLNEYESLYSLVTNTIKTIKRKDFNGTEFTTDEWVERVVNSAVSTFLQKAFRIKFLENSNADANDEVTRIFLERHREDIDKLITQIENYIKITRIRTKCIHDNCLVCKKRGKNERINSKKLYRKGKTTCMLPLGKTYNSYGHNLARSEIINVKSDTMGQFRMLQQAINKLDEEINMRTQLLDCRENVNSKMQDSSDGKILTQASMADGSLSGSCFSPIMKNNMLISLDLGGPWGNMRNSECQTYERPEPNVSLTDPSSFVPNENLCALQKTIERTNASVQTARMSKALQRRIEEQEKKYL